MVHLQNVHYRLPCCLKVAKLILPGVNIVAGEICRRQGHIAESDFDQNRLNFSQSLDRTMYGARLLTFAGVGTDISSRVMFDANYPA